MGVWRASLVTVAVLLGVCVGGSVHAAEQGFPQVTLRAPVADVVVAGDVVTFKGVAKGARSGKKVRIQRQATNSWTTVKRAKVKKNFRFRARWTAGVAPVVTLRAVVKGKGRRLVSDPVRVYVSAGSAGTEVPLPVVPTEVVPASS